MTTSLDIRIRINTLAEHSRGLRKQMGRKDFTDLVRSFSKYVRVLYLMMIEEAMNSNRYKGNWEPVDDEGYLEYIDTNPSIPILQLIQDALEVRKIGNNFYVRFEPHYRYPVSHRTLVQVLRSIDKGTSKFNARPIFNKILKTISSHIIELWRGYLTIKRII